LGRLTRALIVLLLVVAPATAALAKSFWIDRADVEVILDHRDAVLRVPTSVVVDGNRVFVFDADTGRITERPIVTGISNWEFTEITEGLREGERIVSSIDRDGVVDGLPGLPL